MHWLDALGISITQSVMAKLCNIRAAWPVTLSFMRLQACCVCVCAWYMVRLGHNSCHI
jgi:hypothetical protein